MGRRRLDERRRLWVERYLLTLRRHGHQPQLEDSTMTTDTEALWAQFDAWFSDGFPRAVERKGNKIKWFNVTHEERLNK